MTDGTIVSSGSDDPGRWRNNSYLGGESKSQYSIREAYLQFIRRRFLVIFACAELRILEITVIFKIRTG